MGLGEERRSERRSGQQQQQQQLWLPGRALAVLCCGSAHKPAKRRAGTARHDRQAGKQAAALAWLGAAA